MYIYGGFQDDTEKFGHTLHRVNLNTFVWEDIETFVSVINVFFCYKDCFDSQQFDRLKYQINNKTVKVLFCNMHA